MVHLVTAARRSNSRNPRTCSLHFIVNISTYWLDPLRARGPRREGIAEVLRLTSDLAVSEFHDAHRVRWQAIVAKDEFTDPKVGSTEDASHRKPLLVRLRKTRCLNIASTADPLSGLRVLEHGIVTVNLMLCLEIIRVRSCPVTIQSRSNGLVFIHCLPSRRGACQGIARHYIQTATPLILVTPAASPS